MTTGNHLSFQEILLTTPVFSVDEHRRTTLYVNYAADWVNMIR